MPGGFGDEFLYTANLLEEVPSQLEREFISEVRIEGNRRVETEAMMLELESAPGEMLSRRNVAQDIRRLWAMGKFEDIRVETERVGTGVALVYIVKERPTVRKIIVEGN